MQLEFSKAKDGSKTFSADGVFFHSTYSPYKEAERYLQSINFSFEPQYIFLIEPGLSYLNTIIKKKFPFCKTICIRLFDQKLGDEADWDKVIFYSDFSASSFSFFLLSEFGEEKLLTSTIILNQQSQKIFFDKVTKITEDYKACLEQAKTVLTTRQFFEKKWLINSCNFFKYVNTIAEALPESKLPLVICASGPSLKASLNTIKENQDKLFILCLSSALSVLIKNSIKADMILTTDGGFWAGEHLKYLKKNPDILLAAPCEAFIPKKVLSCNPLLSLKYNDCSSFINGEIIEKAGLPSFEALRNPTVSGTGLYLAKAITNNKIYFCGLDLAASKGFSHTQPNELENNNCLVDNRLYTKEKRISASGFSSKSLEIYREWFSSLSQKEVEDLYRVIPENCQKGLGYIKDISPLDFNNQIKKLSSGPKNISFSTRQFNKSKVKESLDFILEKLSSPQWKNQIFPADSLSIKNARDQESKNQAAKRLDSKITALQKKIRKLADDS